MLSIFGVSPKASSFISESCVGCCLQSKAISEVTQYQIINNQHMMSLDQVSVCKCEWTNVSLRNVNKCEWNQADSTCICSTPFPNIQWLKQEMSWIRNECSVAALVLTPLIWITVKAMVHNQRIWTPPVSPKTVFYTLPNDFIFFAWFYTFTIVFFFYTFSCIGTKNV